MFNSGLTCLAPIAHLLNRQDQSAPDQEAPELFSNDIGLNILEDQGLSNFPKTNYNLTLWDAGRIPESCYNITQEPGMVAGICDLRQMDVYNVTYDDCSEPWVICRCSDADEDVDRLATDFGQLPVRARENVRYVVMSENQVVDGNPELEGISLYTQGDLVIYANWSSVGLFVHESAHNLDFWISGGGEYMFSETSDWEAVVDADTCLADYYSKSSYSEAYAQGAVLLAFDVNNSGPLDELVDYDCASNVHGTLKEQLGEYLTYDSEATCLERFPHVNSVCVQSNGRVTACDDGEDDNNNDSNDGNNDSGDDNGGNSDSDNNSDSDDNNSNSDDNNDDNGSGDDGSAASRSVTMSSLSMTIVVGLVLKITGLL